MKFSSHAITRLNSRGINIVPYKDLIYALNIAKEKSINNVAMIDKEIIYIVNVKNETVITCLSADSQVITSIDGVVFL